jgi:DNA-binding MarR family transcriptional regulator
VKDKYLELIGLIERLHRQCLEVIKSDLDRQGIRDLNNVQALILFNVGEEELSIGELTQRGYYLGSNVSYNVKKMVENGYLIQERSPHDRRSFHVRAAEKGVSVYRNLSALFDQHSTLDGVWQLLGFFCAWSGGPGAGRALGCGEVEFSGQIRPRDGCVRTEIEVRRYTELEKAGASMVIGDAVLFVDDEPIYTVKRARVGTFSGIAYPDYPLASANARGGKMERES